jgi:hypothetical protein
MTIKKLDAWMQRTKEAYLNGTLTQAQIEHLKATSFPFPKK